MQMQASKTTVMFFVFRAVVEFVMHCKGVRTGVLCIRPCVGAALPCFYSCFACISPRGGAHPYPTSTSPARWHVYDCRYLSTFCISQVEKVSVAPPLCFLF